MNSIPQRPVKAKYLEVYYNKKTVGNDTCIVIGYYNFRDGYGIVKAYKYDHTKMWSTVRADTIEHEIPGERMRQSVEAINGDVHSVIDTAIRLVHTW